MAINAETRTKKATNTRMEIILLFSVMGFLLRGAIRSKVMVEPEVSTNEDKVDMDAESTSTRITPIRIGPNFSTMEGIRSS